MCVGERGRGGLAWGVKGTGTLREGEGEGKVGLQVTGTEKIETDWKITLHFAIEKAPAGGNH